MRTWGAKQRRFPMQQSVSTAFAHAAASSLFFLYSLILPCLALPYLVYTSLATFLVASA